MMREQERTTTLPGVLATIAAGFDLTARHLWLLLLPIILDTYCLLKRHKSLTHLLCFNEAFAPYSHFKFMMLRLAIGITYLLDFYKLNDI